MLMYVVAGTFALAVLALGALVVGVPTAKRAIEWYDRQATPYGGTLWQQWRYPARHRSGRMFVWN